MILDMKTSARLRAEGSIVSETSGRPLLLLAHRDSAYASRVARAFRRLGWEVHMAATAVEAARLVELHTPQAMFLDIDLPDLSGWEASAQLTCAHPHLRVILVGTERPEHAEDRLLEAGAAGLVLRADAIEDLVRAAYGRQLARAI